MNFEYFFARRMTFGSERAATGLVIKLYILSIALATATMEIALSVVTGFETEIQQKVVGFSADVVLTHYLEDKHKIMEAIPITYSETLRDSILSVSNVESVSPYIHHVAVMQSSESWDGIMLKGVDSTYNWKYIESVLREGEIPDYSGSAVSKDIVISKKQSQNFGLEVGDRARLIFQSRTGNKLIRTIKVAGIYETGMEEFDNQFMICHIDRLRQVWKWEDDQVSGLEVDLKNFNNKEPYKLNLTGLPLIQREPSNLIQTTDSITQVARIDQKARAITDIMPEIFDWLNLQHQNVWVILGLMVVVAIINMTGVILISIIERTKTIGILKALGLSSGRVQRLFVFNAFFLISLGVIFGNILGLGLLWSQYTFAWLKIPQADYFIDTVPVSWEWDSFLAVNLAVVLISTIFMFIPTLVIDKISPLKAIRFD
ncbi:MAG: FtsX-like permease family protein [Bacteroidota bacterium]